MKFQFRLSTATHVGDEFGLSTRNFSPSHDKLSLPFVTENSSEHSIYVRSWNVEGSRVLGVEVLFVPSEIPSNFVRFLIIKWVYLFDVDVQ